MWFDVRKLIASANFQDVPDISVDSGGGAPIDPALAETPVGSPGGMTVGGDPLALSAGPATGWQDVPPPPGVDPTGMQGFGAASSIDPGTMGLGTATSMFGTFDPNQFAANTAATEISPTGVDLGTGAPSDLAGPTAATPGAGTGAGTGGGKGAASAGPVTAQPQPGSQTRQGGGTGGGAGAGAGGANAINNLGSAINGVARAAQAGNPQAQQIMNMLRQMMQQQMMGGMGMMGGGAQYNPYMNQMNPWMARMRMEQMRRQFMERERLRRQLYGAGAGRPAGTFGGHRGR